MQNIHYTKIIRIGNSPGIQIPREFLKDFGEKVAIQSTEEGILIRNKEESEVAPLKEWDKLFAICDTTNEDENKDWELTLTDGIE